MSWAEAKWIHDKLLQATGKAPENMRMFTGEVLSKSSIGLKFLEPSDTYVDGNLTCAVGGVMIRMSETDYPQSVNDGTLVVDNAELGRYETEPFVVSGLVENRQYYFSAFPYSAQGVFKVSDKNRVTATPKDGEIVKVTVNIDDPVAFNAVTITLVNETNPSASQTATITPTVRTANFVVPIGDRYHVEYGEADGYSKPANSASKTSVAGEVSNYNVTYYYFTATIDVTYPEGATCTCSYGGTAYTAPDKTGNYQFKVHEIGTWVIKAVDGDDSESTQVLITSDGQAVSVELSFVKIYGVSRDITSSSPVWARTEMSADMTASASVGTTAGASDFDKAMPWKGIIRETLDTGDVMVKIPKFYYKRYRDGNIEHIKIADKPVEGFTVHPAFNHGGVEKECVYVGAYKTSSNNKSVSGAAPQTTQTRSIFRTNAKAKGSGWGLIDLSTLSAVQMLILVEFANNNSQATIGQGHGGTAAINTGSCDSVPNLTGRPSGTDGETDIVYRGIEGLWGNVWEIVDGVNWRGSEFAYYVSNTPSDYADDTDVSHKKLAYVGAKWSGSYIKEMGLDTEASHLMLPKTASGGSASTYYPDATHSADLGWQIFTHGGSWYDKTASGLFAASMSISSSTKDAAFGSRLIYIPQ